MITNGFIADLRVNDDYDLVLGIPNIPTGVTLQSVWLSVKTDSSVADLNATIFVKITPLAGVAGQITDTGADTVAEAVFTLSRGVTALLSSYTWYQYEIVAGLSNNKQRGLERGRLWPLPAIGQSLS